jgi:hypothetical protein
LSFAWTEEGEELLRKRWAEGIPATEIGFELGCSKSAVLGKKMRLGLQMRENGWAVVTRKAVAEGRKVGRKPGTRNKVQQHADHSQRERLRAAKTRKTAPRIRVVAREGRLVEPLNLPFGDLDDNNKPTMCRFITGERDGQKLFCARPTEHDTSWCDDCCRVAFTAEGYERVVNKAPPQLRQPAGGHVLIAAPFSNRDFNVVGLVREVPFS